MNTRPLARRAGLEGFVTWFGQLEPSGDALPSPAQVLAAAPVDVGLDFTFLPKKRAAAGRVRLACVLVAERDCEVGFSVGSYRGVAWQAGEQRGSTPDGNGEIDVADGTGRMALRAGANVVLLRVEAAKASGYACLRLDAAEGVRVGAPDGASVDADAGVVPEYAMVNRPGAMEPVAGFAHAGWQAALRKRWMELLGALPEGRGAITRTVGETEAGGYVRREIRMASPLGVEMPAYLLLPKGRSAPGPGVLALHGHGTDAKKNVAGVDEGSAERRANIDRVRYDYGAEMARRGYTVLVPDQRNFGARRDPLAAVGRYTRDACDVQFLRGFVAGLLPAQAEAVEWRAWLDVLAAQPQVNAARLGVLGLSLGGRTTGLCAALFDRVKAAVVSGALNLMRERVLLGQGCIKHMLPGLLGDADLPELYGLAAPRALFFEHGADDGTSPEIFAQEAWRRMRVIYAGAGAPERLGLHVFGGGHVFNGTRALPWLEAQLNA